MNSSLQQSLKPISKFFGKHHPTIFITLIALLLIGAVTTLIFVLQIPTATDGIETQQAKISGTFDQATIDRVNQLRQSSEAPVAPNFPANSRSNPFVE